MLYLINYLTDFDKSRPTTTIFPKCATQTLSAQFTKFVTRREPTEVMRKQIIYRTIQISAITNLKCCMKMEGFNRQYFRMFLLSSQKCSRSVHNRRTNVLCSYMGKHVWISIDDTGIKRPQAGNVQFRKSSLEVVSVQQTQGCDEMRAALYAFLPLGTSNPFRLNSFSRFTSPKQGKGCTWPCHSHFLGSTD